MKKTFNERLMLTRGAPILATILLVGLFAGAADVASAQDNLDRTVLPIQPPKHQAVTELDARNVTSPPPFELNAPKDAPNVVVVMIDDIGFGESGRVGRS